MNFERSYAGKKVLVTGGGRGIGRAIVSTLHSSGAKVYTLVKSQESLKSLKEEFPNVVSICVDLRSWEETKAALEPLECMDVLINNAASCGSVAFHDIKPEAFDETMNTNVKGVINVSQVITKKMIAEGRSGAIVNVSSVLGQKAIPGGGIYCTSKAALEMLTKVMAIELGPHKITVNYVNPAMCDTELFTSWIQGTNPPGKSIVEAKSEVVNFIASRTPTQNSFMPIEQVVTAILFLASGMTSQITGSNLVVDGGFLIA